MRHNRATVVTLLAILFSLTTSLAVRSSIAPKNSASSPKNSSVTIQPRISFEHPVPNSYEPLESLKFLPSKNWHPSKQEIETLRDYRQDWTLLTSELRYRYSTLDSTLASDGDNWVLDRGAANGIVRDASEVIRAVFPLLAVKSVPGPFAQSHELYLQAAWGYGGGAQLIADGVTGLDRKKVEKGKLMLSSGDKFYLKAIGLFDKEDAALKALVMASLN